jgi:hypothetical protein
LFDSAYQEPFDNILAQNSQLEQYRYKPHSSLHNQGQYQINMDNFVQTQVYQLDGGHDDGYCIDDEIDQEIDVPFSDSYQQHGHTSPGQSHIPEAITLATTVTGPVITPTRSGNYRSSSTRTRFSFDDNDDNDDNDDDLLS